MKSYVAFLRGINVGGINIKMADLKKAFEDLGLQRVKTVLASGNVLFESDGDDPAALKKRLEAKLSERFDYEAWVVLEELGRVRDIVDAYPFVADRDGWHAYVLLASSAASLEELARVRDELDPGVERVAPGDGVLYWEVVRSRSTESAFGKLSSKARYKSTTTVRNLKTLRKLLT
ncbi:uncharacterized protein (DUF1697 family) [Deinobacterium chartae]|uniref:Uncharacterized protein (DUF1697 family) n=1 Tax=Deinobacterium chartae TaxID=521158 RepID=A0A841I279_9DEIO|nr:uncharacterized protein (DUF1697 family) [Deinobacterium chartae]